MLSWPSIGSAEHVKTFPKLNISFIEERHYKTNRNSEGIRGFLSNFGKLHGWGHESHDVIESGE
jgi:hypothetical protein